MARSKITHWIDKVHSSWFVVMGAAVGILTVILGQVFGWSETQKSKEVLAEAAGQTVTICGKVAKDPSEGENKIGYTLTEVELLVGESESELLTGGGNSFKESDAKIVKLVGKVYVTFTELKTAKKPERSDYLILSGKIQEGFGNFIGSMYRPEIVAFEKGDDFFLGVRNRFAEEIRNYVGWEDEETGENMNADIVENNEGQMNTEAGLELGYLLGMKSEIDDELEETLRVVGLTHMVVASGTHLGILVGAGRKVFGKVSRLVGLIVSGALILVFVGITGLTPSMMRAAFVSGLSLVAWYFGRDAPPWRVLLYAGAVTLLADPQNLSDLAWQLSFGSFTGLMLISPIITRFFYGDKELKLVGASIITSLSTILCCAPILLYSFGTLSIITILANILILPTLAPVMMTGLITGIFGLIKLTPLASLSGLATTLILKYHIFTINLLGAQKSFLITVPKNNALVFLVWVIPAGLIIIDLIKTRQERKQERSATAGFLTIKNPVENYHKRYI